MIKKIRKELLIYLALLVVLALFQHPDLLSSPLTRLNFMLNRQNYFHPLLWTFIVYILIGFVRLVISGIVYLRSRSKKLL